MAAGGPSAMLWDPLAPAENLLSDVRQHDFGKDVEAVSISHDGQLLASGGRDGAICVSKVPTYPMIDAHEVAMVRVPASISVCGQLSCGRYPVAVL